MLGRFQRLEGDTAQGAEGLTQREDDHSRSAEEEIQLIWQRSSW